ncbi:MAG: RNA polymerase-binding protein DksA [Desulfarculaceae bacterium]|nr:RNA polymerase-binding protein DksA [Desulfarculaceae bacterium]MCF8071397.1 RNA polymerase-binding protein DksA [Desulfarculaceae bacterium]MCF8101722.1 RNA polymerase-binding protein DksA [Desulfarculaceae bacterium]MCF8118186.1 RNA polymerase-binding protein DksA [Desulfarculaceae bacterium]
MNQKKLESFRRLLEEKLDELLKEAERTVAGMTDSKENFPDPTDRAAMESDRNFLLRIRDRERKLISKIREALERIDDGTYGICESCGEDISEKRLKARPVTTLCIDCKKRQEANEKARGL